MMPDEYKDMTSERKKYIEETIMSVLFELYEDQTGVEYNWKKISKETA